MLKKIIITVFLLFLSPNLMGVPKKDQCKKTENQNFLKSKKKRKASKKREVNKKLSRKRVTDILMSAFTNQDAKDDNITKSNAKEKLKKSGVMGVIQRSYQKNKINLEEVATLQKINEEYNVAIKQVSDEKGTPINELDSKEKRQELKEKLFAIDTTQCEKLDTLESKEKELIDSLRYLIDVCN
jgi:hypothetical protein